MPYWTTDIGGFFRPGRGQYTDAKYHDILTRWFQWGTFNPIFRIHGYQTETEPWKYGDTVMNNMRSMMNLRYRLMPYIYSEAWQVSKNGSTIMRSMVMDFKNDATAINQSYQYMFGRSFLVAPVTEPGVSEWTVYLPKSIAWYDFWTGKRFTGGQTVKTDAPQDKIPLFVKAGSIVPMGKFMQYTSEKPMDTLEIRIYPGADGQFTLYSDEGNNYNYEKGKYTVIPFKWNEQKQTLTVEKKQGGYAGALKKCVLNIIWVNESNGKGIEVSPNAKAVVYTGEKINVSRK
jgi:alpha-D-xyloside xylohydrolase